jgi:hypothetical protein
MGYRFNPPPNWPAPPPGWVPVPGWRPSPEWPAPPPGWQLWIDDTALTQVIANQPSAGHYPEQPQGQPSWGARYPSTGYSPTGQRDAAPASGPIVPQLPPRRRVSRKGARTRNIILLAIAAFLLIGGIGDALGLGKQVNTAATAPTPTTAVSHAAQLSSAAKPKSAPTLKSSPTPNATAKAEAACDKRGFASGDIYVRMLSPGTQWTAQELGGEWIWNASRDKCLTSVQETIATAPLSAGNCTQVGYVANNPGYNPNATVAAPLTHIAAQAGPACPAAVQPTPVQTKPTAAPVTAASSAPAGCHPLTDSGNCYKPGEYCRDDDHGMSGVAGNGEAIICEDNDGWRWEPA